MSGDVCESVCVNACVFMSGCMWVRVHKCAHSFTFILVLTHDHNATLINILL